MSEFIIGLDLSLANTGVAVYDLAKDEFVYVGSINTEKIKKQKNLYHNALKLKYIYDALSELKEMYPPKVVVMERGFSRFNTATQVLYRVHGVVNYLFHDVNQIYLPPKTIKEAILKGNATKQQIQKIITEMYPEIEFQNEDESDAVATVLAFLIKENIIEYEKPESPKKEKETKKKDKSSAIA